MTDAPETLVLEHLRAIERVLAPLERDGAKVRAAIGGRFDRIHDRLDRIKWRLDLAQAQ